MGTEERKKLHGIGSQFVYQWPYEVEDRIIELVFFLPENAAGNKYKDKKRNNEQGKNDNQFKLHQSERCPKSFRCSSYKLSH